MGAISRQYGERNRAAIKAAFERVAATNDTIIREGMEATLRNGVRYCLEAHSADSNHLEMGDSYGWMLLHDGQEVSREVTSGSSEAAGNATVALNLRKADMPNKGWAGVVLAGMKPAQYFYLKYEFKVMRAGIRTLKADDFNQIFKSTI